MSRPNARKGTTDRPASRAEQQPWRKPEDAAEWRLVARAPHHPAGPKIRLTLQFDDERSAWLDQEAERAGLGYNAFVLRLLDEARARLEIPPT